MMANNLFVKNIALAGMYFVTAWGVSILGQSEAFSLPVYPAAGVALGGLICWGIRLWPGIFFGALAFNVWFMDYMVPVSDRSLLFGILTSSGMSLATVIQGFVGAVLFNRFVSSSNPFNRTKDTLFFIFLIAALGCTVGSSICLSILIWLGHLPWDKFFQEWVTWWLGDLMGVLLVTPLFFVFRHPRRLNWTSTRKVEVGILLLLFYVTSQMVFGDWLQYSYYPLVYLLAPCLVWAAYRFGHAGAVIAILMVSSTAVWGTLVGRGAFSMVSMQESFAMLQSYLLVLTIMTLILSAAVTEKEDAREQSIRFGRVLDESSNEIYLFDAKNYKIIQANRGAQKNLGYTLDELQSLTPLDIKPDFSQKHLETVLEPLRSGTKNLITFRTRHQRKDGTFYSVDCRIQLSHAELYPVFVGIAEDITERKQAERALQESEAKFRQLAENIEEVFWMENAAGKEIVYISPAFEKVWGLKCEDLMKTPHLWIESIHPEDREKILNMDLYKNRKQLEKQYQSEFRITRPDGTIRWIRDRAFPVFSESGEVIRIAGISEDITERRRTELALKENEERLRLVLEATSDGVWDWNISTGEVFFSPQWFRSLGYQPGELKPHISSWEKLVHPDDISRVRKVLNAHLKGETDFYQVENRLLTKSGTYRWNLDRGCIVERNEDGEPLRMVGTDVDITNRKLAEEELVRHRHHLEELVAQRTADLESTHLQLLHAEKLSATGKMAASMAHEFNNPIYGIRNILEKIIRRASLEDSDKRFAQLAIQECDRITMLIRKILDFHSPSTDELEWIDVHESIDDMILLIQRRLSVRGINVVREYASKMPSIEAVPDQFKQVILNILQNAEEAIPEGGGSVTVNTSMVHEKIRIEIKDTGMGISKRVMKNIFDPFFTTKPSVKGTGLGLSVTYGIIKKHRGDILVDSRPGCGTTFTILLPVKQESPSPRPINDPSGASPYF